MAGKEVPHRKPATIVNSMAFFLLSARTLGFRKAIPFFSRKALNVFKVFAAEHGYAQLSITAVGSSHLKKVVFEIRVVTSRGRVFRSSRA